MDDFIHRQRAGLPFNDAKDIFQRCTSQHTFRSIFDLHHQNRTDNVLLLFFDTVILPFFREPLPCPRRFFEQRQISSYVRFRIADEDQIFQQPAVTDFLRINVDWPLRPVGVAQQRGEPLRGRAHAQHQRHGRQSIRFRAEDKLLHDGRAVAVSGGSAPVRLVNDEDKILWRTGNRFGDCLPESGISFIARLFRQQFVFSEQLGIDEINVACLQIIIFEILALNRDHLVIRQVVTSAEQLVFALSVQLGRI